MIAIDCKNPRIKSFADFLLLILENNNPGVNNSPGHRHIIGQINNNSTRTPTGDEGVKGGGVI